MPGFLDLLDPAGHLWNSDTGWAGAATKCLAQEMKTTTKWLLVGGRAMHTEEAQMQRRTGVIFLKKIKYTLGKRNERE